MNVSESMFPGITSSVQRKVKKGAIKKNRIRDWKKNEKTEIRKFNFKQRVKISLPEPRAAVLTLISIAGSTSTLLSYEDVPEYAL